MLFVSNAAELTVKLRSAKPIYTPKGDLLTVDPKIKLMFRHGAAPGWAIKQAIAAGLTISGKPDGTDPQPYYSAVDTEALAMQEGWDKETLEWVEQRLLNNPSNGSTYMLCEPERLKPPWPAYDKLKAQGKRTVEMVAAKIAEKVSEDGYDPAEVAAYEAENGNRAEVLAALAELAAGPAGDPEPGLIAA